MRLSLAIAVLCALVVIGVGLLSADNYRLRKLCAEQNAQIQFLLDKPLTATTTTGSVTASGTGVVANTGNNSHVTSTVTCGEQDGATSKK